MVNNGSVHYDHDKDGGHDQLAGCESQFRGALSETYVAVRYENQKLTVCLVLFDFSSNTLRVLFSDKRSDYLFLSNQICSLCSLGYEYMM